jgi:hypothetical protein
VRAHDQHQIGLISDCSQCVLAVGGGVADVIGGRAAQRREPGPQRLDDLGGLVHRQGGLRQVRHSCWVGHGQLRDLGNVLHQDRLVRSLAQGAFDLLVSGVADQDHGVAPGGEPAGLGVHLGD